jgi:hypothetical protein
LVEDTVVSKISDVSDEEKREKWICSICKTIFNLEYEFFDTNDVIEHDRIVHPRKIEIVEAVS